MVCVVAEVLVALPVQEGLQPGELGLAIGRYRNPAIGPADHGEQREDQDINQFMAAIGGARVGHIEKWTGNHRGRLGVHVKATFRIDGSSVSTAKLRNR